MPFSRGPLPNVPLENPHKFFISSPLISRWILLFEWKTTAFFLSLAIINGVSGVKLKDEGRRLFSHTLIPKVSSSQKWRSLWLRQRNKPSLSQELVTIIWRNWPKSPPNQRSCCTEFTQEISRINKGSKANKHIRQSGPQTRGSRVCWSRRTAPPTDRRVRITKANMLMQTLVQPCQL